MYSRPDGTWYESKRDWWIVLLIWAAALGMLYAGYAQLESGASPVVRGLMFAFFVVAAVFCLWILYGTGYAITSRTLYIQAGPVRGTVRLEDIREVFPTRSPLSSPACSIDRLHVRYGRAGSSVLVSPLQKQAFLRDLERRCPHLVFDGDRLRSTSANERG